MNCMSDTQVKTVELFSYLIITNILGISILKKKLCQREIKAIYP